MTMDEDNLDALYEMAVKLESEVYKVATDHPDADSSATATRATELRRAISDVLCGDDVKGVAV